MDVETISTLIGSLGFPIVCCIVMFIQNSKLQETLTKLSVTLQSMTEKIEQLSNDVDQLK